MAGKKGADKLGDRQSKFVDEYLIDLNATQAYIRAGYSARGAEVSAHRLLRIPKVQVVLEKRMKERSVRTGITVDRVLQEYGRIAFADSRKFFSTSGSLVPIHQLGDDEAAVIAGMDVSRPLGSDDAAPAEVLKIKLVNKLGALDSVARHLGMFLGKDSLDLTLGAALAERLNRARNRTK